MRQITFYFKMSVLIFILIFINENNLYGQIENKIIIGKIDTVSSKILNEKRKLLIYVPNSYLNEFSSKRNYPVVYLLDGDSHFYSVVSMIEQLSKLDASTLFPEMIVVGIPNTLRTRDLTPSHITSEIFMDSSEVKTTGGGENFTAFIEKELIPYIDLNYPTAPYRILIGHSFGGLMVINTLVHHPHLFNSYVAIDPSMWWDNQKVLKESIVSFQQNKFDKKSLYVAMANTIKPSIDTFMLRKDTSLLMRHPRSVLQFTDILKRNSENKLNWNWRYYNDDNHGSVPFIAEYDALRFIFNYYRLPSLDDILIKYSNLDSLFNEHYINISKQMGYTVLPPEPILEYLGYTFLKQNKFDKAFSVFNLNIKNYPKNFNGYDSMGDFYAAKNDKKKAIEYYRKALAIKEYPETRRKLNIVIEEK